jgi:hypothetical protein
MDHLLKQLRPLPSPFLPRHDKPFAARQKILAA